MNGHGTYHQRDRDRHPAPYAPQYKTTVFRSPRHPPLSIPQGAAETGGPAFGDLALGPRDNDLLTNWSHGGEPIGQRMVLSGRVLDENARPVPGTLVEIWQANAGGRYRHKNEGYRAPLDPNFGGCGRTLTDAEGRYHFRTVKPGAYPWPNRANDWRPAHIHVSVFGRAFAQRLITQLYFEGDPLIPLCPIVGTIADAAAVETLVAKFDPRATLPMDALAWRFDIVLRGKRSTPFENRPEGN